MKAIYYLKQHSRGNHSAMQVFYHGKTLISGTKKACSDELVAMRKFCRERYHNTSTNDLMRDFVEYEMGDVFFVKKQDDTISWA